jgi:fructose-1,6-bisphosphatase II / sedoheptulose-1,7-bisphosphatase
MKEKFNSMKGEGMDRTLSLEMVRVTEAAALAASHWIGRGDEKAADQAAVDAMRCALNQLSIQGTVVIGEGERDQAPMLYVGETVGNGTGPTLDIALDPLEGTTLTARGSPGALSVIAFGEKGKLLNAPDVYMEKLAVGLGIPSDLLHLDLPIQENLSRLAQARGKPIQELMVCVLDRPRHAPLIQDIRNAGAGITLISDGDVSAAMATCLPEGGVDLYVGTGGAPEGVLAAAALRCLGGWMQGRLRFKTEEEKERGAACGIVELDRLYGIEELAGGDVFFCATGVTDGLLLKGIRHVFQQAMSHSLVLRSSTRTFRTIETQHQFGN